MAQWVNCLRNNIFVNPPPLPLLCEIYGLHIPTATGSYSRRVGEQAGRQAGGWADGQAGGPAGKQAGRRAGRRNAGEFQNF